nr:vacuolar fusion protein CCZ1 homolog [Ciona intestinalis]|eukprot:XP_002121279.1 vacuolar fusion protein CCZ1 homolog [Ciona intestinalis]
MSDICLASLVVYNTSYGTKEGEEEKKLLFYHPKTETRDKKVNNVGLFEALVQFTRSFAPNSECETLRTKFHQHVFLHAEENFWLVMKVANRTSKAQHNEFIAYEDEMVDTVYHEVLKNLYETFRFLHGTFTAIVGNHGVEFLREELDHCFGQLMKTNLSKCDIMSVYNGVSYLNLDKASYIGFQSFIFTLQDKFKDVESSLLMFNDAVILSGLDETDTKVIVKYLKSKLKLCLAYPNRLHISISGISTYMLTYGHMVTSLFTSKHTKQTRRAFINFDAPNSMQQVEVILYQYQSITACLFLNKPSIPLVDLAKQLDAFMGPQLKTLTASIVDQQKNNYDITEPNLKHVYHNRCSLSVDSTCHVTSHSGEVSCVIPTDVMQVVCDINRTFSRSKCEEHEVINKVHNDHWVASKRTNGRELHVVVNHKNANLSAVTEEIKKVSCHFNGINFAE